MNRCTEKEQLGCDRGCEYRERGNRRVIGLGRNAPSAGGQRGSGTRGYWLQGRRLWQGGGEEHSKETEPSLGTESSGSGAEKASVAGASRTGMVREQVCFPPGLACIIHPSQRARLFMVACPFLPCTDGSKPRGLLTPRAQPGAWFPRQVGSALCESKS